MDSRTRKILTDAFNRKSLAAMHVDLQDMFHSPDWNYAFENAATLSEICREIGVENIWLAYSPFKKEKTTVRDFESTHEAYRHFHVVQPLDNEPVFPKYMDNGYHNSNLSAYTRDNLYDTHFATGVYFDECLKSTILGGLTNNSRNIYIVVRDATDYDISNDYLKRNILTPHEQSGRILYVSLAEVQEWAAEMKALPEKRKSWLSPLNDLLNPPHIGL